jgi:hypothetical protein
MIELKLEEAEAQVMLNALSMRPYMEVAGLIQSIMTQVTEQQQPKESPPQFRAVPKPQSLQDADAKAG